MKEQQNELPIQIGVEETARLLAEQQIVLVDCREPAEWEIARIEGAELVPLSQWDQAARKLHAVKNRRIVVYCHHGIRSLHAVKLLREQGFPYAQSMAGGIDAWSRSIDRSVPSY